MAKHAADGIEAGSPAGPRAGAGSRAVARALGRVTGAVVLLALGVVVPPAANASPAVVSSSSDLTHAFAAGGDYVLDGDVTAGPQTLAADRTLSLDLGGGMLTIATYSRTADATGDGVAGADGLENAGTLIVSNGTLNVTGAGGGDGTPGVVDGANGGNGANGGIGLNNTGVLVLAPSVTVHLTGGLGGSGGNGAKGDASTNGGNGGSGGSSGLAVSNSGTVVQAAQTFSTQAGAIGHGGKGGAAGSGTAAGETGADGTPGGLGNLGTSVTFDANGSGAPATIQVFGPAVGTSVAALAQLPAAWPVNGSELFDAWYTAADGGDVANGSAATSGQTLYAHWTDGSGGGTPPADTCDASTFTTAFNSTAGGTVTLCSDLTIGATDTPLAVAANQNVTLDLNGHSLTVTGATDDPGIGVPAGTSLTITDSSEDHTGTLTATGGYDGAGIGTGYQPGGSGIVPGAITVTGGTVTATGGPYAAGIGGGANQQGGAVTVSGGAVTATGGTNGGAGIGGADDADGGTVTVSGGSVTATGGSGGGAGIGGGQFGAGGTLTIGAGGTVTATAGAGTNAVGSGAHSNPAFGTVSNAGTLILPTGASVTVPSGAVLTNTGTLDNSGTIAGEGGIAGAGTIANSGAILHTVTVDDGQVVTGNNFQLEFHADASDGGNTPGSFVAYGPTLASVGLDWNHFDTPLLGGVALQGWSFDDDGSAPLLTNDTTLSSTESAHGDPVAVPLYASWPQAECADDAAGFITRFDAADGSKTITLCSDLDIANTSVASLAVAAGTSITLDLSGHTLTITPSDATATIPGIAVPSGSGLTIKDSGSGGILRATGGYYTPGIGGVYSDPGATPGTVTIDSGTVVAAGGQNAPGTGAAYGSDGGTVTINGGTVTATGGPDGAGIGAGYSDGTGGTDGGTVTITGGDVTANGGAGSGAGIGGGLNSSGGTIAISGGTVTATGTGWAAGIGGSNGGSGGTVTISGGTVTAIGGAHGAGIGSTSHGTGAALTIGDSAQVTASSAGTGSGVPAIGATGDASGFGSLSNSGTLTIPADNTLAIPAGVTVTNAGTLNADGILIVAGPGGGGATAGALNNSGTITAANGIALGGALHNSGTVANNGTIAGPGDITGDGTVTNNGTIKATVAVAGDQTVTVHHYVLHFDANGGTGGPADITVYATSLAAAGLAMPDTEPTRSGYLPGSWNLQADGSGAALTADTEFAGSATADSPVTITAYQQWVSAGLRVTPSTQTVEVTVGAPSTLQLVATGGTAPYTWSAGTLPDGLRLDAATGLISGTPTAAGRFGPIAITVTDSDDGIAQGMLSIQADASHHGTDDQTSTQPNDTDANPPADDSTGPSTGSTTTPTPPPSQVSGEHEQITPIRIVTITLPTGTVGSAYRLQLQATGGSGTDYRWILQSGALPDGLTLSASGLISGTPSAAGTFTFVGVVQGPAGAPTHVTASPHSVLPGGPARLMAAPNGRATGRFTLTIAPATVVAAGSGTDPVSLASTGVPGTTVPLGIGGAVILLLGAALQLAGRRRGDTARPR